MRKQILRLLRTGEQISGEALSRELGISRAAIGKHIKALRQAGYQIEASPGCGYRLLSIPDILSAEEIGCYLAADTPWKIHYHASLDSTNNEIRRLAEADAPGFSVVIAETQTAGQGRLDRTWHSAPQAGLWLSYLLRPKMPPQLAQTMTLTSACAVVAALSRFGFACRIKWPNDVLGPDGRKLCGIKSEMRSTMDEVEWLLCGIGININNLSFPEPLDQTATSLRILKGEPLPRAPLAAALLEELERFYAVLCREGFAPIRQLWLRDAVSLGQRVRVSNWHEQFYAIAQDLDENGCLIVERDGQRQILSSGDILL